MSGLLPNMINIYIFNLTVQYDHSLLNHWGSDYPYQIQTVLFFTDKTDIKHNGDNSIDIMS